MASLFTVHVKKSPALVEKVLLISNQMCNHKFSPLSSSLSTRDLVLKVAGGWRLLNAQKTYLISSPSKISDCLFLANITSKLSNFVKILLIHNKININKSYHLIYTIFQPTKLQCQIIFFSLLLEDIINYT